MGYRHNRYTNLPVFMDYVYDIPQHDLIFFYIHFSTFIKHSLGVFKIVLIIVHTIFFTCIATILTEINSMNNNYTTQLVSHYRVILHSLTLVWLKESDV